MDIQDVFTEVSDHLIHQGVKCRRYVGEKEFDAYYGANGTRCAVGCLIPDHLYSEDIEGKSLLCPEVTKCLGDLAMDENIMCLLADLQDLHDNVPVNLWPQRLTDVAYEYDLETCGGLLYINECWDQF